MLFRWDKVSQERGGIVMKKKSLIMVVIMAMVSATLMSGCKKEEGTEWVRESIQKLNESKVIQINSTSEVTLEDGEEQFSEKEMIVDKTQKQVSIKIVDKGTSDGDIESNMFFGVEDGNAYQIANNSFDGKYTKMIAGTEQNLKLYLEPETVEITEKSKIEILGEETVNGEKLTKVKIVTPDFTHIQDKEEYKAMYEAAKQSENYKEQLEKAEKEYVNSKEETIVWFNEKKEAVKAERDTSLSQRFRGIMFRASFDGSDMTWSTALTKKSFYCMEFLTGNVCNKIEMPTEYEEFESEYNALE